MVLSVMVFLKDYLSDYKFNTLIAVHINLILFHIMLNARSCGVLTFNLILHCHFNKYVGGGCRICFSL